MMLSSEPSARRFRRSAVGVLVVLAFGVVSSAGAAYASTSAASPASAGEKKSASASVAAKWLNIGSQAKLTPVQPQPQQVTDAKSPLVQQLAPVIGQLSFKALLVQNFAQTQPGGVALVGNYVARLVVFGSSGDAKKFRDADSKAVTDRGQLKKVGSYRGGVVLDDGQGHINAMFTINNVAVDIRIGVTEPKPGDGAKEVKKLGDLIVAKSKKS